MFKDQVKSLLPRCFFERGKVLGLMFLPLFSDKVRIASNSPCDDDDQR